MSARLNRIGRLALVSAVICLFGIAAAGAPISPEQRILGYDYFWERKTVQDLNYLRRHPQLGIERAWRDLQYNIRKADREDAEILANLRGGNKLWLWSQDDDGEVPTHDIPLLN